MPSRRSVVATSARVERAIAIGESGKPGIGAGAVELLVKRTMLPQHDVEHVGRNAPGGKAGYVVAVVLAAGGTGRLPARTLHSKLPPRSRHLWIWHGYAKSQAMPTDPTPPKPAEANVADKPPARKSPLTPAAERALAEAAARRAERDRHAADRPKEIQGRDGPEPTRYGDWEVNGLTSDF